MNKLAVLYTIGSFPEGNARNARIKIVAKAFLKLGYRVEVISLAATKGIEHWGQQRSGSWQGIAYRYIAPMRYQPTKLQRIWVRFISLFKAVRLAYKRRKQAQINYFYCPKWIDSLLLMLFGKRYTIPLIVDQTERFSINGNRMRLMEERFICKNADCIWAISDKLVHYLKSLDATARVKKLGIAVDLERFKTFQQQQNSYTIGYIGTFHEKDNVRGIIRAFAMAKRELPELKLKLMGFNTGADDYRGWINHLGLSDAIEMTGQLQYSDIAATLQLCDTFVLNRTRDEFASYGYPIKLGEYFAAGSPVLISDIGAYADSLEHLNLVYKYQPESDEALSKAILERYSNMELFSRIGQNGRKYAEQHFNIAVIEDRIAKDLIDLE